MVQFRALDPGPWRFHEAPPPFRSGRAFRSLDRPPGGMASSGGTGGGGGDGKSRLYAPKLLTAARFRMLEWSARAAPPHSFLLMLDLRRGGFLCLPSLLEELKARPHERFIWRKQACAQNAKGGRNSSSPQRDDSFLLLSRDVAEVLRLASRTQGATLLALDRLLFRLPLTALHDPARLVRAADADWGTFQLRPLKPGVSSSPHPCDRIVWAQGVQPAPKEEGSGGGRAKGAAAEAVAVSAEQLFAAHGRFTLDSHWRRPAEALPVVGFRTAAAEALCRVDDPFQAFAAESDAAGALASNQAALPQSIAEGTSA